MNGTHPTHLREIEDHRNIDVMWDLVHEHLDYICSIQGVPICWCTRTEVLPMDYILEPIQEYLSANEDMIKQCPMIMVTYDGTIDKNSYEIIGVRLCTPMLKEYSKIVFRSLLYILETTAMWVHAQCTVKTRDRHLAYKIILSHLFGKNTLDNCDAV